MADREEVAFAGFVWKRAPMSEVAARLFRVRWETTWLDGSVVRLTAHREKDQAGKTPWTFDVFGTPEWGGDLGAALSREDAMAKALIAVARHLPYD